jgi:flagellar FliL protein
MSNKLKKANANGKKSPLVLIMLLILATVVLSGGGYLFFEVLKIKNSSEQGKNEKPAQMETTYYYVPLESFTVNLKPENNEHDRVLFIEITLKVNDVNTEMSLQKIHPEVRSKLLILLSRQTSSQLATHDGKLKLMGDIKEALLQLLPENQKDIISGILFNTFIVR